MFYHTDYYTGTSVYQITWHHISEECNPNMCHENMPYFLIASYIDVSILVLFRVKEVMVKLFVCLITASSCQEDYGGVEV
jgi:hypothetical protein